MFKKKQSLFVIVSILLVAAIACAVTLRPLKTSAAEYMQLSKENRMKYAQDRYEEFAKNPDEEYEVLISFNNVSYKEIAEILSGQDNILSAFHCFEANGECAVGGYTECEGKNAETVIEDYYSSVYNLVVGHIESYDDFVDELKKSYEVDTNFVSSEKIVDSEEVYGKENDTSPIVIDGEGKEPDMSLEDALRDAEHSLAQFVLQKEAMDQGDFYIYGIRLVMTGAEIEELLSSDIVVLVEILDFDNNNLLTPIR